MHRSLSAFLTVLLSIIVLPAFGQASDIIQPGEERFTFGLGWVLNAFGTNMRVDNSTLGQGSNVNLKDDLAVENEQSSFWANAEWRFAPRHRIGFSYSQFKLNGTKTLTRQLQIGDQIYPVGASVSSETKIQIIPITYSYSFIKSDRHELAGTVGLSWSHLSFNTQGSASLSGLNASNSTNNSADLPLPLFGLRYDHNFSQNWSAGLQGGYFRLKYEDDTFNAKGEVWSARAEAEYRFSKHLALGLAVEGLQLDVEASKSNWQGSAKYSYWGPQLFLKARY